MGTEYSDYAEGLICRQSPEEGETRKGGGLIIEVWTSAGEAEGTMQNILGMTLQQAQSQMRDMIEEYDLSFEAPEEDRIYSDEYGKDQIVSSVPAAGEPLKAGDTIYLVLSKGPEQVTVPPLTGQMVDAVMSQAGQIGVTFEVRETPDSTPKNTIIGQEPAAGTEVDKGSTVVLTVSSGPEEDDGEGGGVLYPGTDTLIIPLPESKDTVHLRVKQDNQVIFDDDVNCREYNWSYPLLITASGETRIQVYIDDEMVDDKIVTVDGYYG